MSTPKGATKDRPAPSIAQDAALDENHVFNAVAAECRIKDVDELMAEIADAIREPRGGAQ